MDKIFNQLSAFITRVMLLVKKKTETFYDCHDTELYFIC